MPAAIAKPEYLRLRQLLVEARERAGLTQAQVAEKLKRAQSFVSKYELGERRLDVIDFLQVCACLSIDPGEVLRQVTNSKK
ncbi:helix-turn-helix domain-containing protein [Lysobacter enzymogenes]|uniref:helix-turn-helix domain-containing protein n=1 Tax=Lysobacter enzymogenes TaxID=69 RepID=UPI001AF280F6|nr:helix-turn-helix transcriptional regulator [Lysobacter enzymogenes]QQQ02211.1 helix-turn-helix transcriptional regulator [Lysobacter enzymogenes]